MRLRRGVLAAAVPLMTACAAAAIRPNVPFDVAAETIEAYGSHETCAELVPGDRLEYRFESSAPIDFAIRFREGEALVAPISRDHTTSDAGIFQARLAQRYCLSFEAGPERTTLEYHVRHLRPAS